MLNRRLMIVGAGPLQVPAFEEALRMGLEVIALDRDPNAPGMSLAHVARVIDTLDTAGAICAGKDEKIDGVMTLCTDLPVRTVSAVAHALGLQGLSPATALRATDKGLMRAAFQSGNAESPAFRRVSSEHDARDAVMAIGVPAVFKPTCSSGSRGVFQLTDIEQLPEAYAYAMGIHGPAKEILVEEFVDGPEVSVEILSWRGIHHILAITDKLTSGNPYWVEVGHTQPSRHSLEMQNAIRDCATVGLRALGIDNSPSHVEIKVGRSGPKLIEIGARLGGDFITTKMVPRSTGVNMVRAAIQMSLGIQPDMTPTTHKGVAIRYLIPPVGRVVAIRGRRDITGMPGVVSCHIDFSVGDVLRPVHSSLDRRGYILCHGDDASQAEANAIAALETLEVETEVEFG